MRNQFDEQLELLNVELIKMGALCEEAIVLATRALLEGSAASAEKAVAVDAEIGNGNYSGVFNPKMIQVLL